jgi:hypothetical protein
MGRLKPIGSEKLQGIEKLNRIIEISKYKENIPNSINEVKSTEYSIVLSDGNQYSIDREKNGYVIKKKIDESTFDYIEPMKNRNYYRSYSQAFKRLNLIAKEVNSLTGNDTGISLFSEQKYVLKTPKPEVAPTPAPTPETTPPSEEMPMDTGSEEMPMDTGSEEMPMDTEGGEMPMDTEGGEMPSDLDAGFKSIQKLTGKLAQKLRTSDEEEMTADNIKYIVNSILSAVDLSKLEDEDKEDIVARFESDEEGEEGLSPEDMPSEDGSGQDMEMEEPQPPVEEMEMTEENNMSDVVEKISSAVHSNAIGAKLNMKEIEKPNHESFMETILDGIFKESKVDKVLSKYFILNESEKKEQQRKKFIFEQKKKKNQYFANKEIERLCESSYQIKSAKDIIKKYPMSKIIGVTNLNNLVIEHKGSQIKITPKGNIL